MRTLFLLLIPFLLFARTPDYPDTLTMKTGKIYPCRVTGLSDHLVQIIYQQNQPSATGLVNIQRIRLADFGIVYRDGVGFLLPPDSLRNFILKREETRKAEEKRLAELEKSKAEERKREAARKSPEKEPQKMARTPRKEKPGRWSFGIFYVPYYSGRIYEYQVENPYYGNNIILTRERKATLMEGQFSVLLISKLRLTLNIGYLTNSTGKDYTRHLEYDEPDPYASTRQTIESSDLKIFDFNIGLKYYFMDFKQQNVRAFLELGIGKQSASAGYTDKVIDPHAPPSPIYEDNRAEFVEALNSPWHVNSGFGTEYMFNASLGLFAGIRFYYYKISGTYDYKETSSNHILSEQEKHKDSETVTQIGAGLNFYF